MIAMSEDKAKFRSTKIASSSNVFKSDSETTKVAVKIQSPVPAAEKKELHHQL
jgi:hypothetical protein